MRRSALLFLAIVLLVSAAVHLRSRVRHEGALGDPALIEAFTAER